eukprot:c6588_g1_i1.p1 GENE.c6588_g1_i1~~c6588_g1_i1.p1  ORF type:complete len:234 (+),score=64.19 c6588_g1_i1:37-738(+)
MSNNFNDLEERFARLAGRPLTAAKAQSSPSDLEDADLMRRLDALAGRDKPVPSDDFLLGRLKELSAGTETNQAKPTTKFVNPALLSEEDALFQQVAEEANLDKKQADFTAKQDEHMLARFAELSGSKHSTAAVAQSRIDETKKFDNEVEALLYHAMKDNKPKQPRAQHAFLGNLDIDDFAGTADVDDDDDDPVVVQAMLAAVGKELRGDPEISDRELKNLLKVVGKEIRASRS